MSPALVSRFRSENSGICSFMITHAHFQVHFSLQCFRFSRFCIIVVYSGVFALSQLPSPFGVLQLASVLLFQVARVIATSRVQHIVWYLGGKGLSKMYLIQNASFVKICLMQHDMFVCATMVCTQSYYNAYTYIHNATFVCLDVCTTYYDGAMAYL